MNILNRIGSYAEVVRRLDILWNIGASHMENFKANFLAGPSVAVSEHAASRP